MGGGGLYVKKSCIVGVSAILGFITAIFTHIFKLIKLFNSFDKAIEHLVYTISKRTGVFQSGLEYSESIINSLESNVFDVIHTYIFKNKPLVYEYTMITVIAIFLFFIALTFISERYSKSLDENRKKLFAICISCIVCFIAPISWFIMAKGHSFIHTPINYLLWSMPFTIIVFCFGGANIGYIVSDIWSKISNRIKIISLAICIFVIVIWGINRYDIRYSKNVDMIKDMYDNSIECPNLNDSLKIYYYRNNLYYIADKKLDTSTKFFVHVYLKDKNEFENRDFNFNDKIINLPFWFDFKAVKISLPNEYILDKITTGQYTYDGKKFNNIWAGEIFFEDMITEPQNIQAANFTDNNWQKGISNDHKVILLDKPFIEYYSIIDKRLKLVDGSTANIVDVKIKDKWAHIILDRAIDLKNSYPNELNIIE